MPFLYQKVFTNFKHLLTLIDIFTRKGFAILLHSKKKSEVLEKFKILMKQAEKIPEYLAVDSGIYS